MAVLLRFGAIVIVTVLSCVVLGGVWGLVIYLLPQSDVLPESVPISAPPRPPLRSPSVTGVPTVPVPDHTVPPVMVKAEAPAAHPVPFGLDVKCEMEMAALCPEEEGERRACLQRKAAQLSVPCQPALRERLVRMKENMQHMRAACEADRKQFCREVPLGGGAMLQCLESHAQEVSDQCFQFLPKRGRLLN